MAGKLLHEMTWEEAKDAFARNKLAIVPVGSMEQHGPHMPLGTDWLIADHLGRRVGIELGAVTTPVVPVGFASYHSDFPGSLSVTPEILGGYVGEICKWLVKYGTTHIIFVNGHGGNINTLVGLSRALREQGVLAAVASWWEIVGQLNPAWGLIGHADKMETSAIMYVCPQGVRMDRAKLPTNKDLSPKLRMLDLTACQFEKGVIQIGLRTKDVTDTGDMIEYGLSTNTNYNVPPTEASAELGRELMDAMVKYLVAFANEFKKVSLPAVK
ncbi:MAG: creatininase family protein [Bacillota bacterium]